MSERTLEQAKQWLRARADDGECCPCCQQFVKVYPRTISGPMAVTLIAMFQSTEPGDWIHVEREINDAGKTTARSRDYSKLRYWGLIEAHPTNRTAKPPEKSSAGLWRVTYKGRQFVLRKVNVERVAHVYDNRVLRFSGGWVRIEDTLGKRFNYEELMA